MFKRDLKPFEFSILQNDKFSFYVFYTYKQQHAEHYEYRIEVLKEL